MDTKEITKEYMLEEVITKSIQIPGVKVERNKFLAEEFATEFKNIEEILEKGPIEAGITREKLDEISNKLIFKRTSQSSVASFITGIPGGLAMAATIPADVLQFFGMSLRLAQEISYIYGAKDIWKDGQVDDEKVKNQLILYCGVMFGVSGAVSGVRVLTTQVAKTTLKKLPQKALTKTLWYPIIKKIGKAIGISVTKKTVANGVSKVVPIIGGVISGTINFVSMKPMATRLKEALDKATFDYTDEEFDKDIDILLNTDENEEVKINIEKQTEDKNFKEVKEKLTTRLESTKKSLENLTSKIKNIPKKEEPYDELKKLKELLDMNIITQEEFDKKKKELLDL